MKEITELSKLFHQIFGHITMVRSAVSVVVENQAGEVSQGAVDLLTQVDKRMEQLVDDLEKLRGKVDGRGEG